MNNFSKKGIMHKNIKIKQHDISDCGAACLASVSAYYGFMLPISRIRQYAGTDTRGTNLAGMLDASEKLGFIAKAVRIKKESLNEVPLPAIAHLTIRESWHHFVVIYRSERKKILVMDPASGNMENWEKEKFEKQFSGVVLLIAPSGHFRKDS
jgi:ABC-type bacteriocin/lantibiotic exporter with double-glycine peptidase domain